MSKVVLKICYKTGQRTELSIDEEKFSDDWVKEQLIIHGEGEEIYAILPNKEIKWYRKSFNRFMNEDFNK